MVVDMELQEAKDAVFQLMKDKEKIESEMKALKDVLESVSRNFIRYNLYLLLYKYGRISIQQWSVIFEYVHAITESCNDGRIFGGSRRVSQSRHWCLSSQTYQT